MKHLDAISRQWIGSIETGQKLRTLQLIVRLWENLCHNTDPSDGSLAERILDWSADRTLPPVDADNGEGTGDDRGGIRGLMQALVGQEVEVSSTTLAQCWPTTAAAGTGFVRTADASHVDPDRLGDRVSQHQLIADTLGGEVGIPVVERSVFADSRRFTVIDSIRDTQGALLF